MRAVFVGLVLATIGCANTVGADNRVAGGTWGADHVVLDVTAGGGQIQYDCARGAITERSSWIEAAGSR